MADSKKASSKKANKKPLRNTKSEKPQSKYDEKLVVNGTFEQLVKELVTTKK